MAAKILQLPDYCHIFRDFLVEELIFYKSPFEFHYGKCSVIGKLHWQDNLYLQNISLKCLDEKYRLKTSSVGIRLLETGYRANPDDVSSFGIAEMMINERMKHLTFDEGAISVNDKEIPYNSCQLNEDAIRQDIEQFASMYVPVLQVHTINAIDQAEELIQCNLQLRLLRKNRKSKNYLRCN
ncbi:uncharacterized protein LOC116346313 isoform X2 [Contarinia nasturtii]|uniref:uncharacterized protein LOC116346313 isoform X2 n=1 Tax=Contarinia nasturtii TaxID=265458 RepID=UPI0012D46667|nr:uncharacterized protein LOC116346313 isoform X2 [Contarinia nasturtii]